MAKQLASYGESVETIVADAVVEEDAAAAAASTKSSWDDEPEPAPAEAVAAAQGDHEAIGDHQKV